jgi:hypothetical protein
MISVMAVVPFWFGFLGCDSLAALVLDGVRQFQCPVGEEEGGVDQDQCHWFSLVEFVWVFAKTVPSVTVVL